MTQLIILLYKGLGYIETHSLHDYTRIPRSFVSFSYPEWPKEARRATGRMCHKPQN